MDWLVGNLILFSVIGVVAGLWWLYGAAMWALGMPPDQHPELNVAAAILCLTAGYFYSAWLIRLIRRLEYRRALKK